MPQLAELRALKESLHVSASQVSTYLGCPLKYFFAYAQQRRPEKVSIAIPFGTAIHSAVEVFWRAIQKGEREPLSVLEQTFAERLRLDIARFDYPVAYKKDMPDLEGAISMGARLLKSFYKGIRTEGFQVVDVEAPLGATLYDEQGQQTDFNLVGVVDLILMDEAGTLWAVDTKTSSKPYSQTNVDENLQLSAYACLLASNRYVSRLDEVHCRFDVLRKLKASTLEQYTTVRTPKDRRSFSKLACAVLEAISNKAFFPNRSWMCTDCQYKDACAQW